MTSRRPNRRQGYSLDVMRNRESSFKQNCSESDSQSNLEEDTGSQGYEDDEEEDGFAINPDDI